MLKREGGVRGAKGGGAAPTESTRLLPTVGGASQMQQQQQQQHPPEGRSAARLPFSAIAQQQQHDGMSQHLRANPVERLVKHALTAAAAFLLLSFLGVLAVVLKGLGFDRLPLLAGLPPALHSYWVVFAPFWAADLAGLALVLEVFLVVRSLRCTTGRDDGKRGHHQHQHQHQHQQHYGYGAARAPYGVDKNVVSSELCPLVQALVRGVLGALPFLACLLATQVLFCLRLEAARVGAASRVAVWQALLPVLLYEALCVLGALCLSHGSWAQGTSWALALGATLALALRFSPGIWGEAGDRAPPGPLHPLWVAFTPLWALEAFLLLIMGRIALQAGCCARRYKLNAQHVACMVLYALALLLLAAAQAFVAWRRAWEDALDGAFPALVGDENGGGGDGSSNSSSSSSRRRGGGGHGSRSDGGISSSSSSSSSSSEPPVRPPGEGPPGLADALAGIAVFCGVGLAFLGLYLVAAETADHLVTSHGYEDPLPLSRTAKGWEPTGARTSAWLLLGRIEETARLMRRPEGARGGMAATTATATAMGRAAMAAMTGGGRGGSQGQAAGGRARGGGSQGRDLDSPTRVGAGGELQRSNSGSYADLYADL